MAALKTEVHMKLALPYLLVLLWAAQPAFAQFESDEQWQQEAAKQLHAQTASASKQQARQPNTKLHQAAKANPSASPRPLRNVTYGGYGFRPSRGSVRSGYGWRPQRAQLMPQGYSQQQLQQKILRLQQMQQQLGGGAAGQQQKPNLLQMLMGGAQQQPTQQQQQAQPGFNRGELMKSLFGGGAPPEESGQ
jgi:hypothetical protein